MKIIKFAVFFLVVFSFSCALYAEIPPLRDSRAFKAYEKRPKTELSKLIYLIERFNIEGIEIKIDGNIYPARLAYAFARMYLGLNYSQEKAEAWIEKHCYRSPFTNEVMLVRVDGGEYGVGRDFLLRELEMLRQAEAEVSSN